MPGEGAWQTGHSKGCRDPKEDQTQESRPSRAGHKDSPPRSEKTQGNAVPTAWLRNADARRFSRAGVAGSDPPGHAGRGNCFISGLPSHFA